jgi:hypothetical protein
MPPIRGPKNERCHHNGGLFRHELLVSTRLASIRLVL